MDYQWQDYNAWQFANVQAVSGDRYQFSLTKNHGWTNMRVVDGDGDVVATGKYFFDRANPAFDAAGGEQPGRITIDINPTSIAFHNTMNYRQPHPSSFTFIFGCKKGIEYAL